MYRKPGAIPLITSERLPKNLLVFDTEAFRSPPVNGVEAQSLRLGVACFIDLSDLQSPKVDNFYHFRTGEELVDFIIYHTRKDRSLYVYAHNIKYDLQLSGALTGLIAQGFTPSMFVIDDPPTFMRLKRGRASIMLVDTFNYWQYSIKEMGEQLGKLKLSVDFAAVTDEELFTYCERDVEVLSEYLLKFIRFLVDNDLAGMGLTLASQAFRSYRHRFMSEEIMIHTREEVLDLERAGYFGGRTDAFYIGQAPEQDYYKLDVNSMYPYVMSKYQYPVDLVGYGVDIPLERLRELMTSYYCLADIELQSTTPAYPYTNGVKLLFPTGEYRTVLHHQELLYALERGEVRAVRRLAIYNQADIFSSYVSFFYALKQEAERSGDKITRKQAKIFLNALYGKFGQRQVVSKIYPLDGEAQYKRLTGYSESLGKNVEVNYLGNVIEVRYKAGESVYSSPVIAGSVTGNARLYLWKIIDIAGVNHVYYCDTDSVIVDGKGYEALTPLIHAQELGKLKIEGIEKHLRIYSVKDYEYGSDIKVKGVPKSAFLVNPGVWHYEQFRGGKTWVKDGLPVGVEVYSRIKERKTPYDKGIVTPTGKVLPLLLSGGSER